MAARLTLPHWLPPYGVSYGALGTALSPHRIHGAALSARTLLTVWVAEWGGHRLHRPTHTALTAQVVAPREHHTLRREGGRMGGAARDGGGLHPSVGKGVSFNGSAPLGFRYAARGCPTVCPPQLKRVVVTEGPHSTVAGERKAVCLPESDGGASQPALGSTKRVGPARVEASWQVGGLRRRARW